MNTTSCTRAARKQRWTDEPAPMGPMFYTGIDVDEEALMAGPLRSMSLAELMSMPLPGTRFIVEGLLPIGLTLLASPPKFGKSWMVLDLCLSAARGEPFLGRATCGCDCCYFALEDSEIRLQERCQRLLAGAAPPDNIRMYTGAATLGEGLIEKLEYELKRFPYTKLFVIDTLQKIRDGGRSGEGVYSHDYRELGVLKQFADYYGVAVVLVHHLNKSRLDDGDPHNRINGSNGLLGAADTSMVLTKKHRIDEDAVLSVTGRDIETEELAIHFDKGSCRWVRLDEGFRYDHDPLAQTIRRLVADGGGSWSGSARALIDAVRQVTGTPLPVTSQQLNRELLPALDPLLRQRDGILHTILRRGSGSGAHCFRCDRPDPDAPGPDFTDPFAA